MIMKVLLVVGVIAVIYFMFIKKKPEIKQANKKTDQKKETTPSNEMIECAECGIYCALDDTILSGSKYYCSEECVSKA